MTKGGNFDGYRLFQQLAPAVLRQYARSHVHTLASFIQTSRKRLYCVHEKNSAVNDGV